MFLYFKDELLGVEYLYQQTGKVLQDYKLAIEESENTDVEVDEGCAEHEEFQDITVPTFDTEQTPAASSQASMSAASVVPSSLIPPAASSMSSLSVLPPSEVASPAASSLLAQSEPGLSPGAHICELYQSIHFSFSGYQTSSKCTLNKTINSALLF